MNWHKRLEFTNTFVNKPTKFWNDAIFSDKSKYNIWGSDGQKFVWRKTNEALKQKNIKPTVKHGGGNVIVWRCMAINSVGNLVFIDQIMTNDIFRHFKEKIYGLQDPKDKAMVAL